MLDGSCVQFGMTRAIPFALYCPLLVRYIEMQFRPFRYHDTLWCAVEAHGPGMENSLDAPAAAESAEKLRAAAREQVLGILNANANSSDARGTVHSECRDTWSSGVYSGSCFGFAYEGSPVCICRKLLALNQRFASA